MTASTPVLVDNVESFAICRGFLVLIERDKIERARLELRCDNRSAELDGVRCAESVEA